MRTIEYYAEMKNRLARSANETKSPGLKRELWMAFSKCDTSILRLTAYLKSAKRWWIIINIIVLIAIIVSGCQLVQGAGEDITWMGKAGERFLEYRDK